MKKLEKKRGKVETIIAERINELFKGKTHNRANRKVRNTVLIT